MGRSHSPPFPSVSLLHLSHRAWLHLFVGRCGSGFLLWARQRPSNQIGEIFRREFTSDIGVILTYRSNEQEARTVADDIQASGGKCAILQFDVSKLHLFDPFLGEVSALLRDVFGRERIDYLINNAGLGKAIPIDNLTQEDFDAFVDVHFKGVVFLTQKALASEAQSSRKDRDLSSAGRRAIHGMIVGVQALESDTLSNVSSSHSSLCLAMPIVHCNHAYLHTSFCW